MDEKLTYKQIEEAVKVCGAKKTGGSGCFGCPLQGVPRCLNRLFDALVEENKTLRKFEERIAKVPDGESVAALQKQLYMCAGQKCAECNRNSPGEWDDGCRTLQVELAAALGKMHKRIVKLEELVEDRTKDVLFYAEREKWIPTSERNPDRELEAEPKDADGKPLLGGYECIAQIEGAKRPMALWYCHIDGEGVWTDESGENFYRVTHWKPMPKGPEAE